MIELGTIVELTQSCLGNPEGTRGVCYEVYNIGHIGHSFIFKNGEYSGFDEDESVIFLQIIGKNFSIAKYQFINVMQLSKDFEAGLFNMALGIYDTSKNS